MGRDAVKDLPQWHVRRGLRERSGVKKRNERGIFGAAPKIMARGLVVCRCGASYCSASKVNSQMSASVTRREKKTWLASAGILGGPITSRVTE